MKTIFYLFTSVSIIILVIGNLLNFNINSKVLWDEENNIYSSKKTYEKGDSLKIIFNESSLVDYRINFSEDLNKKANTQAAQGNYIDFLPGLGLGDSFNTTQKSSTKNKGILSKTITIEIIEIQANNNLKVSGTHSIRVNDAVERIQINGIVNPDDIKNKKYIYSNDIINPAIVYDSKIIKPDIIQDQDYIQTFTTNISVVSGKTQANVTKQYQISDNKKKQLIIQHLNKVLNILFR